MHFPWTCQAVVPPRYHRCAVKGLKTLTVFKDEAKYTVCLIPCLRPEPRKKYPIQGKNKNYEWHELVSCILLL